MSIRSTATALLTLAAAAACLAATEADPGPAAQAYKARMAGQAERAREILVSALKATPDDASVHFELARTSMYLVDLDRAQEAIERAVALSPADTRYQHWLGVISQYNAVWKYKKKETRGQVNGLMKKALEGFRRAAELRPDFHDARFELVNCYLKNPWTAGGSRRKAERHAQLLEKADAVAGARARCLVLGYRAVEKRREVWRKVVAAHPDNAGAHEGLARAYFGTEEGLSHLDKALALDPSRSEALIDLARTYAMSKKHGQAERILQRYLASQPAPPVPMRAYATFCLARIQKMQGHGDRADAILAEAKKLDGKCWMFFRQPHAGLFTPP